jgi:hypothetical protein
MNEFETLIAQLHDADIAAWLRAALSDPATPQNWHWRIERALYAQG